MSLPVFLVALMEALATASFTTLPRMTGSKNSRMLGPCELEVERAAATGGGTFWGANFLGPNNANRADFLGDGVATIYDTNIPYVAVANYNWLLRADRSARTGTVVVTVASTVVTGTSTAFTTELAVGDEIMVNGERKVVASITSATVLNTDTAFSAAASAVAIALMDGLLVPTVDYAISSNGGLARITLAAAAKLGANCKLQAHFVVPVSLFTFATATTTFARREIGGYDVHWYVSDATGSPSATNAYVSAIGE